jgi:hypothetical protein
MEQGAFFIKDLTGDWPVYPGHPLVLAAAIMKVFPNFEAANMPTEHGWCQALADSRIPGAGDHVGAAMRVLQLGASGATEDAMVECAGDYWDRGNAGGHHKKVEPGRAQAQAVEPHFRELAKAWFAH